MDRASWPKESYFHPLRSRELAAKPHIGVLLLEFSALDYPVIRHHARRFLGLVRGDLTLNAGDLPWLNLREPIIILKSSPVNLLQRYAGELASP